MFLCLYCWRRTSTYLPKKAATWGALLLKLRDIHNKTTVLESLFHKVTSLQVNPYSEKHFRTAAFLSAGFYSQNQSSRGVLKICSKFTGEHPCRNVIAIKMQRSFIEITLRNGCSPVNLLHIIKTLFHKNNSGWLLLYSSIFLSTPSKFAFFLGNWVYWAKTCSKTVEQLCLVWNRFLKINSFKIGRSSRITSEE